MVKVKSCINVLFVAFCLAAPFYAIIPTLSIPSAGPSVGEYDPWLDINDDGTINMKDIASLAARFNKPGQNITKAYQLYDSGWINLTGNTNQNYTLTHNLNLPSTAITVDAKQETQMQGNLWGTNGTDTLYSVIQTSDGGYALAGILNGSSCYLAKTDAECGLLWSKTYGGGTAASVVQTGDGGYALAGSTGLDAYLVKSDKEGKMLWSKTYGGARVDQAWSLVQTVDGGYALAGDTLSFGAGGTDFYLVKTDAGGNMQWSKTYGGVGTETCNCLVQTGDGGYALAGMTASFGAGAYDSWLVKTDADGNQMWNRTYGGNWYDVSYSLVQTTDEGYALAGVTVASMGSYDACLVKTYENGTMQWSKTYGGTDDDYAWSVTKTADGGYALAGETILPGWTDTDVYLVKTDASGNLLWNWTYGGSDDDATMCVVETGDGGYALAGYWSFGVDKDCFLVKTEGESGLAWVSSTMNSITLVRDVNTPWSLVRVQIWKKR
jgi:hypothetical protein